MRNPRQIWKDLAIALVLLAVYFIAGKLGLRLAFVNASASAVWPPTGIALAALLIFGYRFWPAIFIGAFLVNFTTSGFVVSSLLIAIGNTLEGLVGAFLVKRFAAGRRAFANPANIFKFAFLSGMIATAVSASVGTSALLFYNLLQSSGYNSVWLTWWMGDMGGALIVAPVLLLWSYGEFRRKTWLQTFELLLFFLALLLFAKIVFGGIMIFGSKNTPLDFFSVPLLLWGIFRLQQREVSLAVAILAVLATLGTLHGFGPFARAMPNESLLLLQAFLIIASIGSLAVASVINQREKLENDLISHAAELAEEKFKDEALLESIGEGIVATDAQGRVILVNRALEDMLGVKAEVVMGQATSAIMPMEDEKGNRLSEKDRPIYLAFSSGQKITSNRYLLRKDNSKFIAAITATPLIIDGKIIGAVKIIRDITLEKQIDTAKSEFVSLASHQLRTPLTVIKWHASQLLEKWQDKSFSPQQRKKNIEEIYYTNQRMMELVNAILNVSKIDLGNLAVEPQLLSLAAIADGVLSELALQIEDKALVVNKNYEINLPEIQADPKLIRIVFQNLLTNSAKYTPSGGNITLKLKQEGANVLVEVSDTGCGISKEDSSKIFSKFFRTNIARTLDPNGNGLGMYIVKAIVEQAEGKIWFNSEVGKGTTFYVILPIVGTQKKAGAKDLIESYS